MEKINLLSLNAGLVIGGVFCGYALCRSREAPKLNQLIIVILSSAAVAVGINLGYLSLTLEDTFLGKLAEQRIAITLGALAVVWTSGETLLSTFSAIKPKRADPSKNPDDKPDRT